jgi:uncharacterized membrane protein
MAELSVNKYRIQSIDLLRGFVMVIMALDHVRDFFHSDTSLMDPTDLTKTNVALFATRWITHYCAPLFMFLSGTSAFIGGQKKTKKELSIFLFTRGLWLVFLELTVFAFAWTLKIDPFSHGLLVIWALGMSMIVLAAMIWLPWEIILIVGLALVFGHNLLDSTHVEGNNISALLWKILHEQGNAKVGRFEFFILYPLVPWIGVMMLGYCFGRIYRAEVDAAYRKKFLLILGSCITIFFIALRYTNWYGDLHPWSTQPRSSFTVLSFFNVAKYPPSLLYLCMTIGPGLIFLSFTEHANGWLSNIIKVFGRVPMFYYICHLYLINICSFILFFSQGFKFSDLNNGPLVGYGVNLFYTYLVWLGIIFILYFPCRWYDKYKAAHKNNKWLSYL